MARSVEIRIKLGEAQELARNFDLVQRDLDDMRPMWREVSDVLRDEMTSVFDAEGPGWAPLAIATQADRVKHGFPAAHPILNRTGALRASLESQGGDHIEEINPLSMVWGTRVPYADAHQEGTARMPARPILQGAQLIPKISKVFEDRIPEHIRRTVGR